MVVQQGLVDRWKWSTLSVQQGLVDRWKGVLLLAYIP